MLTVGIVGREQGNLMWQGAAGAEPPVFRETTSRVAWDLVSSSSISLHDLEKVTLLLWASSSPSEVVGKNL